MFLLKKKRMCKNAQIFLFLCYVLFYVFFFVFLLFFFGLKMESDPVLVKWVKMWEGWHEPLFFQFSTFDFQNNENKESFKNCEHLTVLYFITLKDHLPRFKVSETLKTNWQKQPNHCSYLMWTIIFISNGLFYFVDWILVEV